MIPHEAIDSGIGLAVALSMLGAFLLGGIVGHAIQAMWAFGAGFHAGRMEVAEELEAALTADDARRAGAL